MGMKGRTDYKIVAEGCLEWWNYFVCYGGDRYTAQIIRQTHKECTPEKVNFTVCGF